MGERAVQDFEFGFGSLGRAFPLDGDVIAIEKGGDFEEVATGFEKVLQILEPPTLNAVCTGLEFPWVYNHSGSLQTQWEYLIPDFPEDQ